MFTVIKLKKEVRHLDLEEAMRSIQAAKVPCLLKDDTGKTLVEKWHIRKPAGIEWWYSVNLYDAYEASPLMDEDDFELHILSQLLIED